MASTSLSTLGECVYCDQAAPVNIDVCAACAAYAVRPNSVEFDDLITPPWITSRNPRNESHEVALHIEFCAACAALVSGHQYTITLADGTTTSATWLFNINSFGNSRARYHISQIANWS